MQLWEIRDLLGATVLTGEDRLDTEVISACGSDSMSDVLSYVKDQGVLLTGLVNPQVIRTADMMDMKCVIFVRGKQPDKALLALADRRGMVVMRTDQRLFNACGLLYAAGFGTED